MTKRILLSLLFLLPVFSAVGQVQIDPAPTCFPCPPPPDPPSDAVAQAWM